MSQNIILGPETAADAPFVLALVVEAFGPGRFAKAAERLRETNLPSPGLSFVARQSQSVIATVRLWPILIGETPALFLGPIAVAPACRDQGLGLNLVNHACDAATAAGHGMVLLVGDEPYFQRAGFAATPARGVIMPGPVDQNRVLLRALADNPIWPPTGLAKPWVTERK